MVGLFRGHVSTVFRGMNSSILANPAWHVDLFVETWSTVGVSRSGRLRQGVDKTGAPLNVDWRQLYGDQLVHLRVEDTPARASLHFHGVRMPPQLVASNAAHYTSTLPNLRKTFQCAEAKRAWELNNNFTYDAVIKLRPDVGCAHPTLPTLVRAVERVLEHQRNASAQPHPFFHGNPWPAVMVSDQTAVGTSAAMDVFMDAWTKLPELFRMECMPQAGEDAGCNFQMTDEKLMKVYLMCYAPFDHSPFYCCPPLGRRSYDISVRACDARRMPGGEDWELLQTLSPHTVTERERAYNETLSKHGRLHPIQPTYGGTHNHLLCPNGSYAQAVRGEPHGHASRLRG